jgi:hypothetical protein
MFSVELPTELIAEVQPLLRESGIPVTKDSR